MATIVDLWWTAIVDSGRHKLIIMTLLRLHLKVVSPNHFKVNGVSIESVRTPGGVLGGFQSF